VELVGPVQRQDRHWAAIRTQENGGRFLLSRAHDSSMFLRALGIFNRSSRLSQLLPQIEQIEPAPLLNQFAVLDANDGRERDRHVLAGRGNALKRGLMGAAYSQAVCNAVTLREDVLERRCCVGEGRPKSVCSRPLTLGSERCRRGIQMSS